MSLRPTLRTAVLVAAAIGAVLLPSAAAVADGTPAVKPPAEKTESPTPAPEGAEAGAATPAPAPEGAEQSATAAPVPADSVRPGTVPRGGVAAGELPAGDTGSASDTVPYGSAAGIALLAGAGVLVLRRRSAAQRNG
ncbi:LPXTG cell wall anchor domain-containing protein [Streptomyces sp. NBC_01460]|uniref:LPXTG cell wall anchor domain-containing protein n=1 Tax=Streptomyces sp. NBC_01460 TaxID=2903875 RepID=UPI002E357BB3|nr:LPXTG cell wall anchor domain-containing protein [Streptomyces sp. NBC_01460]